MLSTAFESMASAPPPQFSGATPAPSSIPPSGPFDQGTDTLWVFLLELLSAPQSYGHVICWTDYQQAEFKLYKPAEVASLWGRRKNRPAMNYDKLSRSLRYYYKKNILRKVPGRKYVYQFCRLDQLLASLNPLNSPIASAYCQIFSQHLAANMYTGTNPPPVPSQPQFPVPQGNFQGFTSLATSMPPMMPQACYPMGYQQQFDNGTEAAPKDTKLEPAVHNTPVSFKSETFRSRQPGSALKQQPLTPSDDEASLSDEDDVDVEDAAAERFDANNPVFHVSPQTAFAQYAAIDGNSQPESIPSRNRTPPSSQITPSASGSEGRTPSMLSSSGEPPAKQANLESSSVSSTSTSSPAPAKISRIDHQAVLLKKEPVQTISSTHIADRRPLKRKPEPLKFTNSSAFSAANLATSAVPSTNQETENKIQQHFAFLNTLNNLQSALSPFATKSFSLFNPLSASLATPQTSDWLKMQSPRPDSQQVQAAGTFTFPPPLVTQFAPLGIPAPLPSPMITTPLLSTTETPNGSTAFSFPPLAGPTSANVQSLLAAATLASTLSSSSSSSSSSTSSSLATSSNN